jgi:hypothetical protein
VALNDYLGIRRQYHRCVHIGTQHPVCLEHIRGSEAPSTNGQRGNVLAAPWGTTMFSPM